MELTQDQIKSIAEEIEMGMKVFVHLETKDIKSLPDFDNDIVLDEEIWEDAIKEIEEDMDNYLQFDPLSSRESFSIMGEFAGNVKDEALRNKLFQSLNRPKPFKHFKEIIDNSGDFRDEWFAFRESKYIELVKEQLDRYNNKLPE
jgi:hypothetical protein